MRCEKRCNIPWGTRIHELFQAQMRCWLSIFTAKFYEITYKGQKINLF